MKQRAGLEGPTQCVGKIRRVQRDRPSGANTARKENECGKDTGKGRRKNDAGERCLMSVTLARVGKQQITTRMHQRNSRVASMKNHHFFEERMRRRKRKQMRGTSPRREEGAGPTKSIPNVQSPTVK